MDGQVYLIVRKPYLRASKIMQERVMKHDKIEVLFEHNAVGLFGENGVKVYIWYSVWVNLMRSAMMWLLTVSSWLSAINPTQIFSNLMLDKDQVGYIVTEPGTPRTKVRAYSPPETLLILTIVKPSPLPELVARQPLKRKDICLRKD